MEIRYTEGVSADFVALCARLDAFINEEAVNKAVQEHCDQFNALDEIKDSFVAYVDNTPVGCVSFKQYDDETIEIKRMFVEPECRGAGIAPALLAAVENKAREKGFKRMILETGKHLERARGLYAKFGFSVMPNYEPYKDMPGSVCMEKRIVQKCKE